MPRRAINKVISTNLLNHPAVTAWQKLNPDRVEPEMIVVLKEQSNEHHKSAVFRLEGVGPAGKAVIGKRCQRSTAILERTIYEEILPHLPMPSLQYYGFLEELQGEFCWLFMEDARGEAFSPGTAQHRALAARWLGTMHTSAAEFVDTALLPDRGPRFYLEQLQLGANTILQSLDNPMLNNDNIAILRTILAQYELLESRWGEVELLCDNIPQTLVHGDFVAKNIYVRTDEEGSNVLPFDWEMAGWGVPTADLSQAPPSSTHFCANPDITEYWAIVRNFWPDLEIQILRRLARFGTLCRLLAAIEWAAQSLASEWVRRPMGYMSVYQSRLADTVRAMDLVA